MRPVPYAQAAQSLKNETVRYLLSLLKFKEPHPVRDRRFDRLCKSSGLRFAEIGEI
jgi:site-specific recombinase XerC